MANKKSNIEILLSARDVNMTSVVQKGRAAVKAFTGEMSSGSGAVASLRGQVLQLAGAFAGLSAIADIGAMLKTADQNAFGLASSIQAANREFRVGSAEEWEARIAELSKKLRIYSETDIRGAAASTIDMTKRLGLNADQMQQVIALSGDLAAGRTDLAGAVERVTAALRGEAEASEYLGLTLNENYVKAWYEAHGAHETAWKDLTDMQKAQVRYNVFLEQAIPLQGKAAKSVDTYAGALGFIRATIANSIQSNDDLVKALAEVGKALEENAGDIGTFVGSLASGAATVIRFVAANRELIIDIIKYGAVFGAAVMVIGKLALTWRGLNAAVVVMTGLQVVPWLRSVEVASTGAIAGITGLKAGFIGLMGAAAVFFAAYKAGEWLTMRSAIAGTAEAQKQLEKNTGLVAAKFKEISAATGLTITSMEQLDQAVKDGKIHYDDLTGTWKKGSAEQAAATTATATTMKKATGESLDAMKKKYQEYASEIRRLQDEIAGRERSLSAELRAMSRTGMSDYSAWKDQKREAEEYAVAAKRAAAEAQAALSAGDTITADQKFKDAVQYADDAKQAYKALNTEVKSGETVVVSQQQALKTAMAGVESSGKLGVEILKQQQAAAKEAMAALTAESGFEDLTKGMDAAEKTWLENWEKMRQFAGKQILEVEQKLEGLVNDRYVTVWVTEKVRKQTGGLIQRLARGGRLPGYGGGDRISALLEAGEFVIRKEAVSKFGAGLFHALNALQLPEIPRFALGGPVGFAAGGAIGASGDTMTINLNFGPGASIPVTSTRENARALEREFRRQAWRSSK